MGSARESPTKASTGMCMTSVQRCHHLVAAKSMGRLGIRRFCFVCFTWVGNRNDPLNQASLEFLDCSWRGGLRS